MVNVSGFFGKTENMVLDKILVDSNVEVFFTKEGGHAGNFVLVVTLLWEKILCHQLLLRTIFKVSCDQSISMLVRP